VRTKLVGFLLHPIARSATWRRLINPSEKSAGLFAPNLLFPDFWRETFAGTANLAAYQFLKENYNDSTTPKVYSIMLIYSRCVSALMAK